MPKSGLLRELKKLRDKNQDQELELKRLEFEQDCLWDEHDRVISECRQLRTRLKRAARRLKKITNFVKSRFAHSARWL